MHVSHSMNTKTNSRQLVWLAHFACLVIFGCWNSSGAATGYANDEKLDLPSWPEGMANLVNTTNRVRGYWCNTEVELFFCGSTTNFLSFLQDYSKFQGIRANRLILHDGIGVAKYP